MSLNHILLGMLESPASGYDLKQQFELQQAHYWSANLAQIYPTLKRMDQAGLIEHREEPSDKGPPRKVYRRTEAGTRELTEWLEAGPEVRTDRLSWLAQVGLLAALEPHAQRRFLLRLREEFARHRAELDAIETGWAAEDPRFPDALPAEDLFSHFTLRLGLSKYDTIVSWCDECIERLDRLDDRENNSAADG